MRRGRPVPEKSGELRAPDASAGLTQGRLVLPPQFSRVDADHGRLWGYTALTNLALSPSFASCPYN